jgi:hypothetical protein
VSVHLIAPPEFYTFTPEQLADICNGCGSKGSRLPVPNSILWLCIIIACNIHDLCYHLGKNKARSDAVFHANILLLMQHAYDSSPRWMRWTGIARLLFILRGHIAWKYYLAVAALGGPAYERAA